MDKEGKVDAKLGKVLAVSLIGIKSNKNALIETGDLFFMTDFLSSCFATLMLRKQVIFCYNFI